MAFIRSKKLRGVTYYAVCECYRQGDKVKQRTVVSLGQNETIDDAIADCRWWIAENRKCSSGEYAVWATIGYTRRMMFQYTDGSGLTERACGAEAKRRAEKLEAKLALLLKCRELCSAKPRKASVHGVPLQDEVCG
jgi:hypothetical protein